MDYTNAQMQQFTKKLLGSRRRILAKYGFFGLLMMHLKYAIDDTCQNVFTDGERIGYHPEFLMSLEENELDKEMLHQLLHIILGHISMNKDGISDEELDQAVEQFMAENGLFGKDERKSQLKKFDNMQSDDDSQADGDKLDNDDESQEADGKPEKNGDSQNLGGHGDDHSRWGSVGSKTAMRVTWQGYMMQAAMAIENQIEQTGKSYGYLPAGIERMIKAIRNPKANWRELLHDIIQEEVNDYSFLPPDRRYQDTFFLPDFNDVEEIVMNVLFMIDTSASMTTSMITSVYSEVVGALQQFQGKLKGWLGFFDAQVVPARPFETEEELKIIHPKGGGGTSFISIFEYLQEKWVEEMPKCIIILTDGFAPWPEESMAMDIPVLWILVKNSYLDTPTPPFGKYAEIDADE